MRDIFEENLQNNTLPTIQSCYEAIRDYPVLKSRSTAQMVSWIKNQNLKKHNPASTNSKLRVQILISFFFSGVVSFASH